MSPDVFEELARRIDRSWSHHNHGESVFADIAADALDQARMRDRYGINELLEMMLMHDGLPDVMAGENEFGDPTITVHRNDRLRIELIFWRRRSTPIHSHVAAGAFQILVGDRIQNEYRHATTEMMDPSISLGTIVVQRIEYLREGAIAKIDGPENLIHDLVFIHKPCITLSVRSLARDGQTPAYIYISPHIRHSRDSLSLRRMALLETLLEAEDKSAGLALALRMLGSGLRGALAALLTMDRAVPREELAKFFAIARRIHGDRVDLISSVLRDRRRRAMILGALDAEPDVDCRILLGLLYAGGDPEEVRAAIPEADTRRRLARAAEMIRRNHTWLADETSQFATETPN